MTFDTHPCNDDISAAAEQLHGELAKTGDDVFITPIEVGGFSYLAVLEGEEVGKLASETDCEINIFDVEKQEPIA